MKLLQLFVDILGEGGLLTDDALLSALGDDVNFNLIDDINQGHENVNQSYEANHIDYQRNVGQILSQSQESFSSSHRNQFTVESNTGLTSSSVDPKLSSSPELTNSEIVGAISNLQNRQNGNVVSTLPIQLSTQQLAALQQQQMVQVRIYEKEYFSAY